MKPHKRPTPSSQPLVTPFEIAIEKMAAGGLGLGHMDNRAVLVSGALPGETVRVQVESVRPDLVRAKTLEVIHPVPERIEPPCPAYSECGGCQLMHVAYPFQFHLKTGAVLERLDLSDVEVVNIQAPHGLFYRDRVRFQIGEIHGRLDLGFFVPQSHTLWPIRFCHQINPRLNQALDLWRDWIGKMPIDSQAPNLLEALAGAAGEGLGLVLNLPRKPSGRMAELVRSGPGGPAGIDWSASWAGKVGIGKPRPLTWLDRPDMDLKLMALPGSFTQINREVNHLMVREVMRAAEEIGASRVLDLYSGFGNFSLPLARGGRQVVSVESGSDAVVNARLNVRRHSGLKVKIISRDAGRAVRDLVEQGFRFDLVILDPPRAGARGLALTIARLSPLKIIYISCHPAALVRDLAEFNSMGWRLRRLAILDMFPQTAHVELMAELSVR